MEKIYLCKECWHIITNPICTTCLSKQILAWIRDKNPPRNKIAKINYFMKNIIRKNEENPTNIQCAICNEKAIDLCIFCFSNKAQEFISKNLSKKILEQFQEEFDSSFRF